MPLSSSDSYQQVRLGSKSCSVCTERNIDQAVLHCAIPQPDATQRDLQIYINTMNNLSMDLCGLWPLDYEC